ncbi:hypothetical protein JNO63_08190 [Anaerococcus sp. mt242]|uniref:hypothetical protein n=1 Tax=Anaerococcus sp. mt242 TaxID=2661917 RepID=UPI0019327354|nr:hypothetical protein [Anaerococcus sp. mt242]MBM0047073.1 hypothetical protein [Anaerococcus sp. mt242]
MKVVICSCARCTAAGNEFLLDSVEEVKADLLKAYSFDKIDRKPEIEVEFTNIMDDIEDPDNSAPLAKVDDTYLEKVMPEELMEHIFNAHTPKEGAN